MGVSAHLDYELLLRGQSKSHMPLPVSLRIARSEDAPMQCDCIFHHIACFWTCNNHITLTSRSLPELGHGSQSALLLWPWPWVAILAVITARISVVKSQRTFANSTNTWDCHCWQCVNFTMGPNEQNQHFRQKVETKSLYIHVSVHSVSQTEVR